VRESTEKVAKKKKKEKRGKVFFLNITPTLNLLRTQKKPLSFFFFFKNKKI